MAPKNYDVCLGDGTMYDILRSFSTTFMLGTVFLIGSALLNAIN
jgi:hypothetical protein